MKEKKYDQILKMIIIGNSGVGKSNMLTRYLYNEFKLDSKSTIGVEFGSKELEINGLKTKLQIWDTAGQERYRSITTSYYKGSKGCFIVYDISNEKSFEDVERWYEETMKFSDKNISIILIGNKSDLEDKRKITIEMGKQKAANLKCPFFETSALSNYQIDLAFSVLAEEVSVIVQKEENDLGNLINNRDENVIEISPDLKKKKKKKCC